jgi:hypothetical protein
MKTCRLKLGGIGGALAALSTLQTTFIALAIWPKCGCVNSRVPQEKITGGRFMNPYEYLIRMVGAEKLTWL